MNKLNLIWSIKAEEDLRDIYNYIKNHLNEPQIANNIVNRIARESEKLRFYYSIYPLIEIGKTDVPIRKMRVKRYMIFYTFYEEEQTIYIVRVLHEKRNWLKIIK